jgi:hypothetical protein|tara:strand:+ start:421 stop:558 length:138 start_codon:yes stop_codon:yes gene_type:complete
MKKVAKFNLKSNDIVHTILTEKGVKEMIDKKIAKAIEKLKNEKAR